MDMDELTIAVIVAGIIQLIIIIIVVSTLVSINKKLDVIIRVQKPSYQKRIDAAFSILEKNEQEFDAKLKEAFIADVLERIDKERFNELKLNEIINEYNVYIGIHKKDRYNKQKYIQSIIDDYEKIK